MHSLDRAYYSQNNLEAGFYKHGAVDALDHLERFEASLVVFYLSQHRREYCHKPLLRSDA